MRIRLGIRINAVGGKDDGAGGGDRRGKRDQLSQKGSPADGKLSRRPAVRSSGGRRRAASPAERPTLVVSPGGQNPAVRRWPSIEGSLRDRASGGHNGHCPSKSHVANANADSGFGGTWRDMSRARRVPHMKSRKQPVHIF